MLRRIPTSKQEPIFTGVYADALDSRHFFEEGSRTVGETTKEQIKALLRVIHGRRHTAPKNLMLIKDGSMGTSKAKGLRSLPVRRVREVAVKHMLEHMPQAAVKDVIAKAAQGVDCRLDEVEAKRARREFFQPMAEDFVKEGGAVTESLVSQIGVSHSAQLDLLEKEFDGKNPFQESDADKVEADLHVAVFNDYAHVFDTYPYVTRAFYNGRLHMVLGYASWRNPNDGKLMRRNCMVDFGDGKGGQSFNDLVQVASFREGTRNDEVHRFIKVVPLVHGTTIKFWTNVKGEQDIPDQYRYGLVRDRERGKVPYVSVFKDAGIMQRSKNIMNAR